jgi:hypothetical protein
LRFPKAQADQLASPEDPLAWPSDAFDQWYRAYPRKKAPKEAARAFEKLRSAREITFSGLIAATERYASEVNAWPRDRRQFIPYPATWLNKGSYAEEPEAERSAQGGPAIRDPATFSDADWSERVRYFEDRGEWSGAWGPNPNEEGCRVPRHILIGRTSPPMTQCWSRSK